MRRCVLTAAAIAGSVLMGWPFGVAPVASADTLGTPASGGPPCPPPYADSSLQSITANADGTETLMVAESASENCAAGSWSSITLCTQLAPMQIGPDNLPEPGPWSADVGCNTQSSGAGAMAADYLFSYPNYPNCSFYMQADDTMTSGGLGNDYGGVNNYPGGPHFYNLCNASVSASGTNWTTNSAPCVFSTQNPHISTTALPAQEVVVKANFTCQAAAPAVHLDVLLYRCPSQPWGPEDSWESQGCGVVGETFQDFSNPTVGFQYESQPAVATYAPPPSWYIGCTFYVVQDPRGFTWQGAVSSSAVFM